MIQVTKKDKSESDDNIIRRFNRKVSQSGVMMDVKLGQYFEKPLSKTERRKKAIISKQRRAKKLDDIRMGRAPEPRGRR